MKKTLLLLIIIFSSCYAPKYTYSGDVNSRLNFNKGKWLLNEIKANWSLEESLTTIANENFHKLLGSRFSMFSQTKGLIIPGIIQDTLDKYILKDIKNGTGFDFFVNIRIKNIRNDIGDIQIGSIISPVKNLGRVTIDVYDLNLLEKIYTQSVTGNVSVEKSNADLALSVSTHRLIIGCLKRIFRKIKKNKI